MVEQLCAEGAEAVPEEPSARVARSAPTPAPAGKPWVLVELKRVFEIPALAGDAASEIGPDRFPLRIDSPLGGEHGWLSELFNDVVGARDFHLTLQDALRERHARLDLEPARRGALLLAAAERQISALMNHLDDPADFVSWRSQLAAERIVQQLAQRPFQLDRDGAFDFLLYFASLHPTVQEAMRSARNDLLAQVEREVAGGPPLTDGERYVLHLLRASEISAPLLGVSTTEIAQLTRMIGDGAMFYLVPGEAWSDAVNAEITALPPPERKQWTSLLEHLLTATAARPPGKWLKSAGMLSAVVGPDKVRDAFERWLLLVPKGRTFIVGGAGDSIHQEHADCLRGMLWLAPALEHPEHLARAVTSVALSAYRKLPGIGPRAVKLGNAAVYALSKMASIDAVGQLALLKVRVRFGTAQKEIEKAFNAAAEALGLPRDRIEEMGVPSYGMEEVGLRRETFAGGEYIAELRVDGRDVALWWSRADGKPQKSVPAKVKSDHPEELKELQVAAKDIAAMLPAQAERIDSLFLSQMRWPHSDWRERYLDHPLIGTIARRLIWTFRNSKGERSGIWSDGRLVDVEDRPLIPGDDAEVELWHPIARPLDQVLAWRMWLERHQVRQPFKQAHRELYILTDAERQTGTYSNRFAAHILRQHQFNALCAARTWKNKLRLLVDDTYPPAARALPAWGLRAEFWVEGIGEVYATDTNGSGVFLRIATDQVRFYRTSAAENTAHARGGGYESGAAGPGDGGINTPIPLEWVPPLVLSEVLRDVDLFVGVASVGNDPTWQDGGPEGRYRAYWLGYSFGDLTETARTRKAVLERLVPRLKIAGRCSLADRFLVVRGDLRTYKIHLGSGNILMEPNDQYLCIVPSPGTARESPDLFLPFEGDSTLSVILSKAFLLAEDKKIKDPTITRQIRL